MDDAADPTLHGVCCIADVSDSETESTACSNMSAVYVMQIGCVGCPGDSMIRAIIERKLHRVCIAADHFCRHDPNFTGWIFLTPSPRGVADFATLNYCTVAVKVGDRPPYDSGTICDCRGGHDDTKRRQCDFQEVRRFAPVRVTYTNGRGPQKMPVGDEATQLMAALETGKHVESYEARKERTVAAQRIRKDKYGITVYEKLRGTVETGKGTRALAREKSKARKMAKHAVPNPFCSVRVRPPHVPDHTCCERRACSDHYRATREDGSGIDVIVWYRSHFQSLSEEKRRHFIAQRVSTVASPGAAGTERQWVLETPGEMRDMLRSAMGPREQVGQREVRAVCGDFYTYVLGVTKNKLYQPGSPSTSFQTTVPRASLGGQSQKPNKAYYVVLWLLNLSQFYLHDPTADRIILPFADRRAVYDLYEHEMEDEAQRAHWAPWGTASRSYFYRAWREDVNSDRIKVRKTLRFSLCPQCVAFIEARTHTLCETERNALKKAMAEHHGHVRRQRGFYYKHRYQAVSDPDNFISVILDAADQSAFGCPHHYLHSKGDDKHWKIATHLMGALVHGRRVHGWTFLPNIKHGSNITIETLHRVLDVEFRIGNGEPFKPRVLYLQLDNTTKQCKSQYVLGFLALLVAWGVFREVVVSFLPVGHTHEDIDQLFSRIALYLRKNDATSRLGFRDAIVAGFRTSKWGATTLAGDIESAANLSDWLEQYLAPMAQISSGPVRRDGIYKFHQFKFSMLGGAPIMQVREWCGEDEDPWRGLMPESTHHVVFDDKVPSHEDLVTECPPAQRSTLPTNPDHFVRNAQGEVTSNHTSRTRSGVEAIIRNRKITGAAQADLQRCLALMESTEDLPFHWDMSMYRAHASPGGQASAPVAQGIAALVGLRNEGDASAPSNEDNTSGDDAERKQLNFSSEEEQLPADKDGFTPAPLVVGNIHLVRLEGIDWGLARSVVGRHVVYWVSGEERITRRGKRRKLPHIYIRT